MGAVMAQLSQKDEPEPIVNRWELAITAEAEVVKAEDLTEEDPEEGEQ